MRVYQFRHVGIDTAILLRTTRIATAITADYSDEQLAAGSGAHGGTRTPTPEGTWT